MFQLGLLVALVSAFFVGVAVGLARNREADEGCAAELAAARDELRECVPLIEPDPPSTWKQEL